MSYLGNKPSDVFPSSFTVTNATVEGAFTSQGIDDNANANAITIDNSENVGIGTSSPNAKMTVNTGVNSSTRTFLVNNAHSGGSMYNAFGVYVGATDRLVTLSADYGESIMAFQTNSAERMRIDSSGNIAINSTTTSFGTFSAAHLRIDTDSSKNGVFVTNHRQNQSAYVVHADNNTGIRYALYMVNGSGGEAGKITYTNTTVTYATTSDHRLKENVTADWDATTRLKQLNPVRFNFISNADTTVDGFLAHEVQSVVPEAITGTHNEVEVWKDGEELPDGVSVGDNKLDEDGNTIPVYQGIDQAKLVPLLVKTIQELEARITALESA